ncbi:unnamed protein product [Peronospora destructor]|uniref:Protein kinase domain-containing protein n=1 Tax=Peronospora destructor TaxID=86335 RepID=A0AAV0V022_9STRA|nr:unnamed protein product [Peronospora destructor]
MTATLVYACNRGGDTKRAQSSRTSRHIKVSSRLAPQIYLGHIYRSLPAVPSSTNASSTIKVVVVKCAGQLQRDGVTGRLQGPWKEWQATRQLRSMARSHPNVVQVFDTFVQRSHVFVVMEHCARGDLLADLMVTQPESRLEQHQALRIVLHLARTRSVVPQVLQVLPVV